MEKSRGEKEEDPSSPQERIWAARKFVKAINGNGSEPPINGTDIENEGGFVMQPEEKPNIFLGQFDISGHLGEAHIRSDQSTRDAMASQAPCPLYTPALSTKTNNSLDTNRKFLLHVFNRIYATGYVPQPWKEAGVIPLIRPGKPRSKRCFYRPISLTYFCKAYERWINTRLMWMLESKNLLPITIGVPRRS
jgi:hypothetical protein